VLARCDGLHLAAKNLGGELRAGINPIREGWLFNNQITRRNLLRVFSTAFAFEWQLGDEPTDTPRNSPLPA
jgi:hypothetical protein